MNFDKKQILDSFPNNPEYLNGEYLIARDIRDIKTGKFRISCDDVDSTLILAANAATNILTLIDGSEHKTIPFTIVPLFANGDKKNYTMTSFINTEGVQVRINKMDEKPLKEVKADIKIKELAKRPCKTTA